MDSLLDQPHWRSFTVVDYGSFERYAAAMKALEGSGPVARWDTSANVVHGRLLLTQPLTRMRHRFAHIYAEWVFDRLTHNRSDQEPSPAWLYDGLAESIAQRVYPTGRCGLHGVWPIPRRDLVSPRNWNRLRRTGAGSVEYCEAERMAVPLVQQLGWPRIARRLNAADSWHRFASSLRA